MIQSLLFVTSNDHKAREVAAVLGREIERANPDIPEIQSLDVAEVSKDKAEKAFVLLKRPLFVEDASLEVAAWNGFPGPFTKWIKDSMGYQGLIDAVPPRDRRAVWRVVYAFHDGQSVHLFEGALAGSISTEPRGDSWGFDVLFVPEGETRTIAELGPDWKTEHGARALGLLKLKDFLERR